MSSQSSQPEQGKRPQLRAIPERRRSDRTQTSGTAALAGDTAEVAGSVAFDAEVASVTEAARPRTEQQAPRMRVEPAVAPANRPVVPPPAMTKQRKVAQPRSSVLDRMPHVSLMAVVLLLHVVGLIAAVVYLL